MKQFYSVLTVLLLLAVCPLVSRAQDPNFSQFFFKESYYNPAFTGINPGLRAEISNRQFWTNVPGLWSMSHASVDFFDGTYTGAGFGLFGTSYTKGELIGSNALGVQLAKRFKITSNFILQLGGNASFNSKAVSNNLVFGDQLDARLGQIYETEFNIPIKGRNFADFGAGMVARFNIAPSAANQIATNNIGISFSHLTQPNESFLTTGNAKLPLKMNIHAYSIIKISRSNFYNQHFLVAPGIIFERQALASNMFGTDEASAKTLSFGANTIVPTRTSLVSSLYLGLWARKQFYKTANEAVKTLKSKDFDALIFMFGFIKYGNKGKQLFRLAYSYDMTISNASYRTGGSHELTLCFEIHDLALPGAKGKRSAVDNPNEKFFNFK